MEEKGAYKEAWALLKPINYKIQFGSKGMCTFIQLDIQHNIEVANNVLFKQNIITGILVLPLCIYN